MYRTGSLRQEAAALREIADGCSEHAEFCRLIRELAGKCEWLADTFGDHLEYAEELWRLSGT